VDIGSRSFIWLLTGHAAAIVAGLFVAAGLSVRFGYGIEVALWASVALFCLLYRPPAGCWRAKLVHSLESIALLMLISTLGALGTYAIAALTTGYADHLFATVDRALGFDWVGLYGLTVDHFLVALIGRLGYMTIFISPAILLIALHWTGRHAEARRFMFAFTVALAATLLIFALVPARAALAHYLGTAVAYLPVSGIHHVRIIEDLRAGAMTAVDLSALAGLVAFPSFHAASAIIYIWAARPVRWLRTPMLAINLLMLASTPIEGGHYAIDLLGGAMVAALGIFALRLVAPAPAAPKEVRPGFAARWRLAKNGAPPLSG
jgi:hypothetical protein